MELANFFSPDYRTARSRFRQGVNNAGGTLHELTLDARAPSGDSLTIDIGWFGASEPRRVLVHSSGLHGVEGFAGSAIQLLTLENLPVLARDAALILTHMLNPFGAAWLRRVNENNVDLNRNFFAGGDYAGSPEGYAALDPFLNPPSPPRADMYILRAGALLARHGMGAMKRAVVSGQYEYPRGLFFGGKQLEEGLRKYHMFLSERLKDLGEVVAIDVHTGLGKYGEDLILAEDADSAQARAVFGNRVVQGDAESNAAYRVRGGLAGLIRDIGRGARVCFVTQEFGTYGPMHVLGALRQENRWHHYGGGSVDHAVKRVLKETFCPEDPAWKHSVVTRGSEILRIALERQSRDNPRGSQT